MSGRTARRGQDPRDRLHPLHRRPNSPPRTPRRSSTACRRTRRCRTTTACSPATRRRTACSTRAADSGSCSCRTSRSSRACSPASTGAARSARRARGWRRGAIGPASSSTTTSWRRSSGCEPGRSHRVTRCSTWRSAGTRRTPRRLGHRRRDQTGPGRRQRRRRRMAAHPGRPGRHRHPPHPLTRASDGDVGPLAPHNDIARVASARRWRCRGNGAPQVHRSGRAGGSGRRARWARTAASQASRRSSCGQCAAPSITTGVAPGIAAAIESDWLRNGVSSSPTITVVGHVIVPSRGNNDGNVRSSLAERAECLDVHVGQLVAIAGGDPRPVDLECHRDRRGVGHQVGHCAPCPCRGRSRRPCRSPPVGAAAPTRPACP